MKTGAVASLAVVALWACGSSIARRFPVQLAVPESPPAEVDAVLFLIGDAGAAGAGRSPVLSRLTADVERWSQALARDSAVSVAYLGDIVYPDGVHRRGESEFRRDSVRLWNQINVVGGPHGRAHHTLGLFLAGNHDWGNMVGAAAAARIRNLGDELDLAREATGAAVSLVPEATHPGPAIRDLRDNVRLLFLDTHWWLHERSEEAKSAFFHRFEAAVEGAGEREIIILGHHPWASAGPHGVVASGSRAFGVMFLLSKSGSYVQDLNSPAYKDFRARMRDVFERAGKDPLVFAAGHDHSLQVLSGSEPRGPRHILISGAGSKLTSVEDTASLRHAAARPGYMSLVFRRDDSIDLFVYAGSPAFLACPAAPGPRAACMEAGADSFATVYSDRLLTPR